MMSSFMIGDVGKFFEFRSSNMNFKIRGAKCGGIKAAITSASGEGMW